MKQEIISDPAELNPGVVPLRFEEIEGVRLTPLQKVALEDKNITPYGLFISKELGMKLEEVVPGLHENHGDGFRGLQHPFLTAFASQEMVDFFLGNTDLRALLNRVRSEQRGKIYFARILTYLFENPEEVDRVFNRFQRTPAQFLERVTKSLGQFMTMEKAIDELWYRGYEPTELGKNKPDDKRKALSRAIWYRSKSEGQAITPSEELLNVLENGVTPSIAAPEVHTWPVEVFRDKIIHLINAELVLKKYGITAEDLANRDTSHLSPSGPVFQYIEKYKDGAEQGVFADRVRYLLHVGSLDRVDINTKRETLLSEYDLPRNIRFQIPAIWFEDSAIGDSIIGQLKKLEVTSDELVAIIPFGEKALEGLKDGRGNRRENLIEKAQDLYGVEPDDSIYSDWDLLIEAINALEQKFSRGAEIPESLQLAAIKYCIDRKFKLKTIEKIPETWFKPNKKNYIPILQVLHNGPSEKQFKALIL